MGILRTDRVSGLGGANAIKGSVNFGSNQGNTADTNLAITNASDLDIGAGNFTIEYWFNCVDTTSGGFNTSIALSEYTNLSANNAFNIYHQNKGFNVYNRTGGGFTQLANPTDKWIPSRWHHFAWVRSGTGTNENAIYLDGVSLVTFTNALNYTSGQHWLIGANFYTGSQGYGNNPQYGFSGHLSNVRVSNVARYSGAFTPPKAEYVVDSNTILLTCQSPSNILKEVTGKEVTYYGGSLNSAPPQASRFTPNSPVGFSTTSDVGTQFGTTFDGVTTFDSQAYFVPPGGNTRERNRGRGIFAGGDAPIGFDISSIEIQSQGNAVNFGDLTQGRLGTGAVGSSTRGVISSGYAQPSNANVATIDFVTIANASNATSFGDSTQARHELGASSSQTRGLFGGGTAPSLVDTIDFVTIATAGDASDFGNLTVSRRNVTGVSSPTRSVFMGGRISGDTASDVLDFVTIASTGNATDFGNLTTARGRGASVCSNTRGVMCGGETPTAVNTIDFITIASAGNATDFGDCLTTKQDSAGGASNNTRGVFLINYVAPAYTNAIQFITIATTGNASDFGDNTVAGGRTYGFSDSHGGLS